MITDINSEDRLVQRTFADHLRWESLHAWNEETFGPGGMLGRTNEREMVLVRDVRAAQPRFAGSGPPDARSKVTAENT